MELLQRNVKFCFSHTLPITTFASVSVTYLDCLGQPNRYFCDKPNKNGSGLKDQLKKSEIRSFTSIKGNEILEDMRVVDLIKNAMASTAVRYKLENRVRHSIIKFYDDPILPQENSKLLSQCIIEATSFEEVLNHYDKYRYKFSSFHYDLIVKSLTLFLDYIPARVMRRHPSLIEFCRDLSCRLPQCHTHTTRFFLNFIKRIKINDIDVMTFSSVNRKKYDQCSGVPKLPLHTYSSIVETLNQINKKIETPRLQLPTSYQPSQIVEAISACILLRDAKYFDIACRFMIMLHEREEELDSLPYTVKANLFVYLTYLRSHCVDTDDSSGKNEMTQSLNDVREALIRRVLSPLAENVEKLSAQYLFRLLRCKAKAYANGDKSCYSEAFINAIVDYALKKYWSFERLCLISRYLFLLGTVHEKLLSEIVIKLDTPHSNSPFIPYRSCLLHVIATCPYSFNKLSIESRKRCLWMLNEWNVIDEDYNVADKSSFDNSSHPFLFCLTSPKGSDGSIQYYAIKARYSISAALDFASLGHYDDLFLNPFRFAEHHLGLIIREANKSSLTFPDFLTENGNLADYVCSTIRRFSLAKLTYELLSSEPKLQIMEIVASKLMEARNLRKQKEVIQLIIRELEKVFSPGSFIDDVITEDGFILDTVFVLLGESDIIPQPNVERLDKFVALKDLDVPSGAKIVCFLYIYDSYHTLSNGKYLRPALKLMRQLILARGLTLVPVFWSDLKNEPEENYVNCLKLLLLQHNIYI